MLADLKFSLDCSQMRFLLCARKLWSSLLCGLIFFTEVYRCTMLLISHCNSSSTLFLEKKRCYGHRLDNSNLVDNVIYGAYQLHPWTFVVRIKNGKCSETVEGRYWAGRIVTEASLKQLIARSDIFQLCPTSPPPTYSSCHYKAITNTSVVANYHLQIITANLLNNRISPQKVS